MRGKPWSHRYKRTAILLSMLLPLLAACSNPMASTDTGGAATSTTTVIAEGPSTATAATTSEQTATTEATATTESTTEATATTEATSAATSTAEATATEAATTEAATATEVAAATATAIAGPAEESRPQFGAVAHLYYTDRERVLQLAENAGFEWIRQQVTWKDTEVSDRTFGFQELDQVVESVNAKGKKLMLSIVKAPDFLTGRPGDHGLPKDPKDFGRFVEEMATRYKGKLHAIEVWNEQNLAVENGGRVVPEDAGRYVEILKEGYKRIKAVDPTIVVVAGALSSTGVTQPDLAVDDMTYLKAMYEYNDGEIKEYLDAQGFHPASALNPPDAMWPDEPGPGCDEPEKLWCDSRTHYFRHIEDVREVMEEAGLGDRKIWITEMGWATENNSPGYEYGNYISFDQQADYLEGALSRTVFQYGEWVGAVFIWNLNFGVTWGQAGNPLHEQAAFGLLNPDWSPRPAYLRIQAFINAVKSGEQ